jgi:hypothetical protein
MNADDLQLADTSPVFLLFGVVFALVVVLGFRRWFPQRAWMALTLAILFGPAGHLYLKGAAPYVLLMYAGWLGLLLATPLPPAISMSLLTILSVMLMNVRLRTAASAPPGAARGPE